MICKLGKVLKSTQVLVSGSVRLDIGGGMAPVRTATSVQTDTHTSEGVQEARIIESNSEYAIIELVCGCGGKSHIQCNYGGMTEPEASLEVQAQA